MHTMDQSMLTLKNKSRKTFNCTGKGHSKKLLLLSGARNTNPTFFLK